MSGQVGFESLLHKELTKCCTVILLDGFLQFRHEFSLYLSLEA